MSDDSAKYGAESPPATPGALDEWLRSHLDHRMTIVLLRTATTSASAPEHYLAAAAQPHAEIRFHVVRCPAAADSGAAQPLLEPSGENPGVGARPASPALDDQAIERTLLAAERLYPDVLLVEQDEIDETRTPSVLRVADRLGLLDRAFVALIGPLVTRSDARRRGYEDGYSLTDRDSTDRLLRTFASEAVARDQLRRHGSSPPCYL